MLGSSHLLEDRYLIFQWKILTVTGSIATIKMSQFCRNMFIMETQINMDGWLLFAGWCLCQGMPRSSQEQATLPIKVKSKATLEGASPPPLLSQPRRWFQTCLLTVRKESEPYFILEPSQQWHLLGRPPSPDTMRNEETQTANPTISLCLLGAGQSGGLFAGFHSSEGGVVPASWSPGCMPTNSTAPQRVAKGNRPIGRPGPMGLRASRPGQR